MNHSSFSFFLAIVATTFICSGFSYSAKAGDTPHSKNSFFVLAVDGLDLHTSAYPSSEVIKHVPYGESIELIKRATTHNLKINRVESGMAEVSYKGTKGYIFEGFISKFPAPVKVKRYATYVETIRKNQIPVFFEENRKDWGSKNYEHLFTMHLPTDNWVEAFLVSQQLFAIPERVFLPKQFSDPNELKEYKNDLENLSKEVLRLQYDATGFLEVLTYQFDGIGEDQTVTLTFVEKDDKKYVKVEQMLKLDQ